MRSRMLAVLAAVTLSLVGCDKIPFIGGGEEGEAAPPETTQAAQPPPAEPAPAQPVETAEPPAAAPISEERPPLVDEPWEPIDTGTVRNGMTRWEVIAVWGVPEAERRVGEWTYLYFRNGCEVTCGTFDVVFLENDQVIDAIVRGPGHNYEGISSSPPDREAQFTPPKRPGG
ncbi:MAG: hypothetical protein ACE5PT_06730 [Gemmatimonadales bacterium]